MITFVLPDFYRSRLPEIAEMRPGEGYPYWLGGAFNWVAQSYLVLREFREGMSIGVDPQPGRMNFAHSTAWRALGRRRGEFRIGVRADYSRLFDIDVEVLQNPTQVRAPWQVYLPYWSVPGLIPRDPSRRGVETVAYAGRIGPRHLAPEVRNALADRFGGMEFRIVPPKQWHDMRDTDLLIAVRDFDRETHNDKPASKLWNAWRAGIPLIAGWDSAFSAEGNPGQDYMRVGARTELFDAIQALSSDPDRYRRLVEAGRARAGAVSHESFAQRWLSELDRVAVPAFETWKSRGPDLVQPLWRATDVGRDSLGAVKRTLLSLYRARGLS